MYYFFQVIFKDFFFFGVWIVPGTIILQGAPSQRRNLLTATTTTTTTWLFRSFNLHAQASTENLVDRDFLIIILFQVCFDFV